MIRSRSRFWIPPAQYVAAGGGGRHAIVEDWEARIITNGGTVSEGTLDAADDFVNSLDADGILSAMLRVNLCAGDDLAASLTPLINTAGATSDTGTSMTGSDYAENLGWLSDGSTNYIDTGYTPSGATGGLGAYVRTALTSNASVIGCRNGGFSQYYIITYASSGTWSCRWGGALVTVITDASPSEAGFYYISRTTSTNASSYFDGTFQNSETTSTTPAGPSASVYVLCRNGGGSAGEFTQNTTRVSGYVIDTGLGSTGAADLYTAIQAFNAALGRSV